MWQRLCQQGESIAMRERYRLVTAAVRSNSAQSVRWLDRAGIWLSALCVAHCLTSTVLLVALAGMGSAFLSPIVHEAGLMLAVIVGAIALGLGVMRHGYLMPFAVGSFGLGMMTGAMSLGHGTAETVATLAGVLTLALGHDLNGRAHAA